MIGPASFVKYFLTYSDTERVLLGSRRRFGANGVVLHGMGFSDENRIFMENQYVLKGYGAKQLIKDYLNKGWGLQGLNKLLKKNLQETGTKASIEKLFVVFSFSIL